MPAVRYWVEELEARSVCATLLVVPGPWRRPTLVEDGVTGAWLRAAAARHHEVALHGWDHGSCPASGAARRTVGRLVARGTDEFHGLDRPAAAARLAAGRRVLTDQALAPAGFTPPGWLASRSTLQAAGELGLRYLATQTAIIDLRRARRHRILALSNRPGGTGEAAGAALLRHAAPILAARGGVRIALHPDDADRSRPRRAALDAVDAALAASARPLTYLQFVQGAGA